MNLTTWSPFKDLDDLLDRYMRGPVAPRASLLGEDVEWRPAASIIESDKEYLVEADLPGVEKKDIEVSVESGVLSIKGERRIEKTSDADKQHRREAFYGAFSRSFALPENAAADRIHAECKDGVLRVHIPKTEAQTAKARSIEVQ